MNDVTAQPVLPRGARRSHGEIFKSLLADSKKQRPTSHIDALVVVKESGKCFSGDLIMEVCEVQLELWRECLEPHLEIMHNALHRSEESHS